MLIITGTIIGLCLLLFIAGGVLFNPSRITPEKIVVASPPTDITLNGQDILVQPVLFGHANIYFIRTDNGYILVDTGNPGTEDALDGIFDKVGVDPKNVQLIVLTHGHMDHMGNIAHAKKVTGAKVLAHQSYAENLKKGEIEPAVARNFTGQLFNFLTGLLGTQFEGVKPDILLVDEFDLNEFDLSGKVIHTPGHSPSSISIVLDNGETLVGDMIREEEQGKLGMGNYCDNEQDLRQSLERVAALESSIIYLSHGSYIDNLALRSALEKITLEVGE